jgi:hypothetical protein
VQAVEPADEVVPMAQFKHAAELLAPVTIMNLPAAHAAQLDAPTTAFEFNFRYIDEHVNSITHLRTHEQEQQIPLYR